MTLNDVVYFMDELVGEANGVKYDVSHAFYGPLMSPVDFKKCQSHMSPPIIFLDFIGLCRNFSPHVACHQALCGMLNLRNAHVALSILGANGHFLLIPQRRGPPWCPLYCSLTLNLDSLLNSLYIPQSPLLPVLYVVRYRHLPPFLSWYCRRYFVPYVLPTQGMIQDFRKGGESGYLLSLLSSGLQPLPPPPFSDQLLNSAISPPLW